VTRLIGRDEEKELAKAFTRATSTQRIPNRAGSTAQTSPDNEKLK
jgi:hypothetical protein